MMMMKMKLLSAALPALVLAVFVGACSQPSGGGSAPPITPGNGIDSGIWALLLGTWQSDDGKLKYEFEESQDLFGKIVKVNGVPPYEQWMDFFDLVDTVTATTISGDDSRFEYVLSDNNQTLTVSNFQLTEEVAGTGPGPVNFNGTLGKQP
jgi:hypothetical protein